MENMVMIPQIVVKLVIVYAQHVMEEKKLTVYHVNQMDSSIMDNV